MEIAFKKNIGDPVWLMDSNRAVEGVITGMKYSKIISPVSFKIEEDDVYEVKLGERTLGYYHLDKLFDTKEDLINSL